MPYQLVECPKCRTRQKISRYDGTPEGALFNCNNCGKRVLPYAPPEIPAKRSCYDDDD